MGADQADADDEARKAEGSMSQRAPRQAGETRKSAGVQVRQWWNDFTRVWVLIGASLHARVLHQRRNRARELLDRRDTLIRALDGARRHRGRPDPSVIDFQRKIRATTHEIEQYTNAHRSDYLEPAFSEELPEDTALRLVLEHGLMPSHDVDLLQQEIALRTVPRVERDRTAERQRDELLELLSERRAKARRQLAHLVGGGRWIARSVEHLKGEISRVTEKLSRVKLRSRKRNSD